MKTQVWVVEWLLQGTWIPTMGVQCTRRDGRNELQDWQRKMPDDRFRLIKYVPANNQAHGRSPVKPLVGNVVTVELDDVVTNPDDMKRGNVSYVGVRKTNKETA